MDFATHPLLQRLQGAQRVMICGAGGGHDLYAGLPLYFYLLPRVEAVFLGNVTFSSLTQEMGRRRTPALTEIDADTPGSDEFFPERVLCQWFRSRAQEVSVFCFQRTGVLTLIHAWRKLVEELQLDAIVLADGGTDSLMRGDESGLGTPDEDLASIAAVHTLQVPYKVLACLGFGVDTFDQVCHVEFLAAVAELQRKGGFLGAFSLLPEMKESKLFLSAVNHCVQTMPNSPSIVSTSVASALEGHFGDYHRSWRTEGGKLFISPLMSMYWNFEVDAVARRCLYLKQILKTRSYGELSEAIQDYRRLHPPRQSWQPIPY